MEMHVEDVGSAVMHLLFKFRFEENPFDLIGVVDKDIVVERHGNE